MWIDPDSKTYSEAFTNHLGEVEKHRLAFNQQRLEPTIKATGSKENLKKLQDDLRRRGYRKLR